MDGTRRPGRTARLLPTVVAPLAVAAVVIATTVGLGRFFQPDARPFDLAGVLLLLAGPAALMARRRHPAQVLAAAVVAVTVYLSASYPFVPVVFLPAFVALVTTILAGRRRAGYGLAAVGFAALLLMHLLRHPGPEVLIGAGAWFAWLVAVVVGAELWRSRRERAAQAVAALQEAERRHVVEQRLAIARELHDVLGHHVSLINVQAGVALYLLDSDADQARDALAAIKTSSRELLREMRSALGVLRGVDAAAPRSPTAGLARLDELVAENAAAGLTVVVEVRGTKRELPPTVDLAVYRIVQESLTNVRRHAGADRAHVLVDYADAALVVQIDDRGCGPASERAIARTEGEGLPGMRARVGALGGSLQAGSRPGGGFRVQAMLPTIAPTPMAAAAVDGGGAS